MNTPAQVPLPAQGPLPVQSPLPAQSAVLAWDSVSAWDIVHAWDTLRFTWGPVPDWALVPAPTRLEFVRLFMFFLYLQHKGIVFTA